MYKIETTPSPKLLHLSLNGYWDTQTVDNFERDINLAMRRVGWGAGEFVALVDLREHGVQSQDVATRARQVIVEQDKMPRRLAVLVTSAVAKMQASRIVAQSSERIFTDEAEARRWLFSPDDAG